MTKFMYLVVGVLQKRRRFNLEQKCSLLQELCRDVMFSLLTSAFAHTGTELN